MKRKRLILIIGTILVALLASAGWLAASESGKELSLNQLSESPKSFRAQADLSGEFTWWLPAGADAFVLPMSAGGLVDTTNAPLLRWLKEGSPWELTELPILGVRYGERTAAVIVPWPHYAELVVAARIGVRFQFPVDRTNATPCEILARWCGNDPLHVATAFRHWRETASDTGAIPKPRSLAVKAAELPAVTNLFGAPHIYLWGPALFSRHDVDKKNWTRFAHALQEAETNSFAGRLVAQFSISQQQSLAKLTQSEWAEEWLTLDIATAINATLTNRTLLKLSEELPLAAVIHTNSLALGGAMRDLVHDPATWGDGFSLPLLEALRAAGIDRALLLLSDLYGKSPRPEVARKAAELGYLIGPYDSYHSVHNPKAALDATWETAQFDQAGYAQGRVQNADGSGHGGFKGRGYHLSPTAAWPYMQQRVQGQLEQTHFSAWFIDCDATAECFDDYNPRHPATKVDDIQTRRERLRWLEAEKKLIVGSEGGSVLFADVIHFGHGPQTPYLGHLAKEFKDAKSASFLGRYWPSDTPANSFKAIPVPHSLITPYFDPRVRIPLYRAALGDEVIVSHHWSFDSLKLADVAAERELMELLYLVPPMYHLNRETWPQRRQRIVQHFNFWSPLHRQLATAPLTRFETLTPDRLLQRTTFRQRKGEVTITVNFSKDLLENYPPLSATVAGPITVSQAVFRLE